MIPAWGAKIPTCHLALLKKKKVKDSVNTRRSQKLWVWGWQAKREGPAPGSAVCDLMRGVEGTGPDLWLHVEERQPRAKMPDVLGAW